MMQEQYTIQCKNAQAARIGFMPPRAAGSPIWECESAKKAEIPGFFRIEN
jgi:hypothetical protein